mgnify:CR=1 FL=1|jgi:hypothetical protein
MKELINLDICVINALNLQKSEKLPQVKTPFKNPLVVGSGNAAAVGKMLFSGIHANESNYLQKIKENKVDGCILISASAGKHAPKIAKKMKSLRLRTILLTNNPKGKAVKLVSKTHVFPKNIEPYTYNTSTYLGMILSITKEDPQKILKFLKTLKIPSLKKYKAYTILVPEKFDGVREFYETKFDELFGPKIIGKSFTFEEEKHAKTVVKSSKELFVGLGVPNKVFGKNHLNYPLPKWANHGLMFCLGYYIIGKIQAENPPWFKRSIKTYVKEASRLFKEKIKIQS